MFMHSNNIVWDVKHLCLVRETILFDDPNNIVSSVEQKCQHCETLIFKFINTISASFTPSLFGRAFNQEVSSCAFFCTFSIQPASVRPLTHSKVSMTHSYPDNVYFAKRLRMQKNWGCPSLGAKKGILEGFVWRFVILIMPFDSQTQLPVTGYRASPTKISGKSL